MARISIWVSGSIRRANAMTVSWGTGNLHRRVARALVEYEMLWQASWLRGMDAALACLNSTLMCYNPESGTPQKLLHQTPSVTTCVRCHLSSGMLLQGPARPNAVHSQTSTERSYPAWILLLWTEVRVHTVKFHTLRCYSCHCMPCMHAGQVPHWKAYIHPLCNWW